MGVRTCHKNNCTSIMCDTYIESLGYICYDCQEEFKKWLIAINQNPQTKGEIMNKLKSFMDMPKSGYQSLDKISINDFFNENTK